MSELHRVRLAAGSLAELALGLAALIDRFDALVTACAPPRTVASGSDEATDPALDVVLGLIALRTRLLAQLDHGGVTPASQGDVPTPESWLR